GRGALCAGQQVGVISRWYLRKNRAAVCQLPGRSGRNNIIRSHFRAKMLQKSYIEGGTKMQLRWKSRLFILMMAGALSLGMTGYAVRAVENGNAAAGTETSSGQTDISKGTFEIELANESYTYSGKPIEPEISKV